MEGAAMHCAWRVTTATPECSGTHVACKGREPGKPPQHVSEGGDWRVGGPVRLRKRRSHEAIQRGETALGPGRSSTLGPWGRGPAREGGSARSACAVRRSAAPPGSAA